jgi:hypothetical protein
MCKAVKKTELHYAGSANEKKAARFLTGQLKFV